MFSKFRWLGWFIGIIVISLFLGRLSFISGQAAEANGETVYLPLVSRPETTPTPVPSFEERVVELTNQEREANGCSPVTMEPRLQAAAEGHSADMALNDFFSHTGSNGSSPWDRIHAQGYSYSRAGENIAAGYSTPESVVTGWMNSDGHRANILNCSFVHIGVGYYYLQNDPGSVRYRHYWTQVFASP
ncbi:MAG TPA: CAP domain-containing protein [Chloroflexi bacterium]|nr:CAP domain-containing protein [Chloroflexota bacterium]HBY06935.1 CAP domain-containing protein [Chloroflexota bacterium]